jgi:hypothetical protein
MGWVVVVEPSLLEVRKEFMRELADGKALVSLDHVIIQLSPIISEANEMNRRPLSCSL